MGFFTGFCLGFFWGCVITELCEKYKKKHKSCCSSSQTECLEQGVTHQTKKSLEESLIPKTEDIKEE